MYQLHRFIRSRKKKSRGKNLVFLNYQCEFCEVNFKSYFEMLLQRNIKNNQTKVAYLLVKVVVYYMATFRSKEEGGFQEVMSTGQVGIILIGQLAFASNGNTALRSRESVPLM